MEDSIVRVKQADEKYCSACAKIIHVSAEMCPVCGAKQQQGVQISNRAEPQTKASDQKFCTACGSIIHASADSCPKCGAKFYAPTVSVKSKVAAGLLAIFLGGIGVHKFYLGRIVWGFVYLIFCWTFIPGVIGFIEGVYYLAMDENKFNEKVRLGII